MPGGKEPDCESICWSHFILEVIWIFSSWPGKRTRNLILGSRQTPRCIGPELKQRSAQQRRGNYPMRLTGTSLQQLEATARLGHANEPGPGKDGSFRSPHPGAAGDLPH